MSRRRRAVKREILPDAKFGDIVISRFMNALMYDGKKSVAEKIIYDAMGLIERRLPNENPIDVFNRAVENVKPIIEVRDGKVEEGGKQRTRSKALTFLIDKVKSYGPVENLSVIQADCDDKDAFIARVQELAGGADVIVGDIGPVVGTHAGRGTIGVAFHLPG